MAWFLVPAGSKGNTTAEKNRSSTLVNKYHIAPHHAHLTKEVIDDLNMAGADSYVNMWGARDGERNPLTWEKMKRGDKVIFYAEEKYMYYGVVLTKIRRKVLADNIWSPKKPSESFEYIYFLVDVQEININGTDFNRVFGYPKGPQGFKAITQETVDRVSGIYDSVENAIETLMKGKPLDSSAAKTILAEGTNATDNIDQIIKLAQNQKIQLANMAKQIKTLNEQLSQKEMEVEQLKRELDEAKVQPSEVTFNEDYQSLLQILQRARKLGAIEERVRGKASV